jgi:hypothetical protein
MQSLLKAQASNICIKTRKPFDNRWAFLFIIFSVETQYFVSRMSLTDKRHKVLCL